MQHFCSISQSPGTTGEYFYSKFFQYYGISADYRAVGVQDLEVWINSGEWHNFEGISVTMPFKQEIIKYLHSMDDHVNDFDACNTVMFDKEFWRGFNSDVYGILATCKAIPKGFTIQILGDGAMSRGFQIVLNQAERDFTVFSRRIGNWVDRNLQFDCRINTTSFGTRSAESPFSEDFRASLVMDLAIPIGKLSKQCEERGIQYVGGMNFYEHVFIRQFLIYTGIEIESGLFQYFLSIK